MNNILNILILALLVPFISYGQKKVPEVNRKIVKYVESVIGKTVGRGECWDLADLVLTKSDARFDKSSQKTIYIYGEIYDPEEKAILPGDIIQFENVTISYQDGNMIFTEKYKHHTAVVYKVNGDNSLKLAHQNTSFGGRKVALSNMDLRNVKKGDMYFYRPIKN